MRISDWSSDVCSSDLAADEVVPFRQGFARRPQPVGAGRWQPGKRADLVRGQPHAIGHERLAPAIMRAAATVPVEQLASDVGRVDFAGGVVLNLVETTFAASVAQRLPFGAGPRRQRLLPEPVDYFTQRFISSAMASEPLHWGKMAIGTASQTRHA